MPKGEKYSDDVRYRAFALLAASNNVRAVAKRLDLPESTVRNWKKQYEADPDQEFAKVCAHKKRELAAKSFLALDSGMNVLMRRMQRADEQEDALDKLCEAVVTGVDKLTQTDRKMIYAKFSAIRCEDISKVGSVVGILHDKLSRTEQGDGGKGGVSQEIVFADPEEAAYAD